MKKRPLSVTVIGVIFLAAGVVGLAYHAMEFKTQGPFQYDIAWVCFVRLVAVLCAASMLRGHNWARWLLVVWIAYHVVLSAFHTPFELIAHSLLFVVVTHFLFRRPVSTHFRGTRAGAAQMNRDPMAR